MSATRRVFDDHAADYDRWFDENAGIYRIQLQLLGGAVPAGGLGLEVGVGSGRFAAPLGIRCGIDPSRRLAEMAKGRGVDVAIGVGEYLPYRSGSFDYAVMMTVICYLDDVAKVFGEVHRVLVPSGIIAVGFLERDGEIYRHYCEEPVKGRFLRHARFRSYDEVFRDLRTAGFMAAEVIARKRGFCVLTGKKAGARTE